MKRIFKRKWQKTAAIALAAIMALAGADQLIAGGLASIAQNALANLQGEAGEDVIPPSLQAYLDELQEEYDSYYGEGEDLLPPSLAALHGTDAVEVLDGTYVEKLYGDNYYYSYVNEETSEVFEGYTPIDDLLESLGLDPAQFYIGNYGGPSPFADSFLNMNPLALTGAFAGVGVISRTSVSVTTESALRSFVSGAGWPAGVTATTPVQINLGANINLTGDASNSLNLNSFFHDIYISSPVNAAGDATFAITANGASPVSPAIRVGQSGAPGRRAYVRANVTSDTASGNNWQGIHVDHASTLSLRGNVARVNTRRAGSVSGVQVTGASNFYFLRGRIQLFTIGVRVQNGSTMTMDDDEVPVGNNASNATTIIIGNRNSSLHTESGNLASDGNWETGDGGGVWVESSSRFYMRAGRIGTTNNNRGGGGTSNAEQANAGNSGRGGGGVRVVGGSTFTLLGGSITGNRSTAQGSGSSGTITSARNNRGGGGVMVDGAGSTFNMEGGYVHRNMRTGYAQVWDVAAARNNDGGSAGGGGVYVGGSATFNMTGGTISANNARRGGGVVLNDNGTVFNMDGTALIYANVNLERWNNVGGGGVHVGRETTFNMHGGAIRQNGSTDGGSTSNPRGGGVFIMHYGHMNMTGGTIADNRSGTGGNASAWNLLGEQVVSDDNGDGGGIFLQGYGSTLNITGGYILANQSGRGGGISITNSEDAGRVNISGSTWIVGNHAFNTATSGGGGGIALRGGPGHGGIAGGSSGTAGNTDYTMLSIAPSVLIAGNTVAANHQIGATTAAVQAQARRSDDLFTTNTQIRPDISTFNSFYGLGTQANNNPPLPANIGPGTPHPANPFNNLDIRTTVANRNWTAVPPAVYRYIFIHEAEDVLTPLPTFGPYGSPLPAGVTELTGADFPLRSEITLLSMPGWTGNPNVAGADAIRPGNLPNTFEVLEGYYWRTQQPTAEGASPVPTFQYTFREWHRPHPINIPSRDLNFSAATAARNSYLEIPDDGILRFAANAMSFNMPPFPIVFHERLNRTPVRPGTIEITTEGARLFDLENYDYPLVPPFDPNYEYAEDAVYVLVGQDSRPPAVIGVDDDGENIYDTPTNPPVIINIYELLDNMGYPFRRYSNLDPDDDDYDEDEDRPYNLYPVVPAAYRYFNDPSATWQWVFGIRVYDENGEHYQTLTMDEFKDSLDDPSDLPFSYDFREAPYGSPFYGREQYEVVFSIYYNMPVNKTIVARLRVTDAHAVPSYVYSNELHLIITRTNRYPARVIILPYETGATPGHFPMQQHEEIRFHAVVLSQFGEDISHNFAVTWTQPTTPGSGVGEGDGPHPTWPNNPSGADAYLSVVPAPFESPVAADPYAVPPVLASPGVPHNSVDIQVDLNATMGTRINLTAIVTPLGIPPAGYAAPVTFVEGITEIRIAEAPRFIASVEITNLLPSITAGNSVSNYAVISSPGGATYYSGTAQVNTLTLTRTLRSQFPNEIIGVLASAAVYDDDGDIVIPEVPASLNYPTASVTWTIDYVTTGIGANIHRLIPDPYDPDELIVNPYFPTGIFIDPVTGVLTVDYTTGALNGVRVRATANSANHDKYVPAVVGPPAVPAVHYYESDTILVSIVHPTRTATTVVILDNETPNTNIAQSADAYIYARVFDQFGVLMPSALVEWTIVTANNITLSSNIPNFEIYVPNPDYPDDEYADPYILESQVGHNAVNVEVDSNAVVTNLLATPPVPARTLTAAVVGASAVTATHTITIVDTPRVATYVSVVDSDSLFIYYGNSPSNYAANLGSAEVHSIELEAEVLSQFLEALPQETLSPGVFINHWTEDPNLTWEIYPGDLEEDETSLQGITITPDDDRWYAAHLTVDYTVEVTSVRILVTVSATDYDVADYTYYVFEVEIRSTPAFKDRIVISSAAYPTPATPPVSIIQAGNHTFEAQVFDQFNREIEEDIELTWALQSPVPDHVTSNYDEDYSEEAVVEVGSEASVTPVGDYFLFRATSKTPRTTMDAEETPEPIPHNYAFGEIQVRITEATRFPLVIEVMEEGEDEIVTYIEVYQGWNAEFDTVVRNQFLEAGSTLNQPMLPLTPANNMDENTPALTWSIVGPISYPVGLTNDYITIDPSTGELTIGRNALPQSLTVRVRANDYRRDPSTNLALEDEDGDILFAYTEFILYVRRTERFADVIRISSPSHAVIEHYYIEYGIELESQSIFEVVVYDQFGDVLDPEHEDFPNLIWNSSRDDVAVWAGPTEYRRTIRVTFVEGTVQVGQIAEITITADAPRLDNVPFDLPSGKDAGTYANAEGSVEILESEPRPIAASIFLGAVPVGGRIPSPTFNPNVYTGEIVVGEPGSMKYFIDSEFVEPIAPAIELERLSDEDFTVVFFDRLGRVVEDPNFLDADWDIVEVSNDWYAPFYEAGVVDGSISLINETNSGVTVDVAHDAAVFGGPYPSFYIIARSRAYEVDSMSLEGVFATARINIVHHVRTPVSIEIINVITEYGELAQEALVDFPYEDGVLDIYAYYEHRFIAEALDRLGYSTDVDVNWSRSTPPLILGPGSAVITPSPREDIIRLGFSVELPVDYGYVSSDGIFTAYESPDMHNHIFTITVNTVGDVTSLTHSVQVRIRSAFVPALEIGTLPFAEPHLLDDGGYGNIHLGTSSDELSVRIFNLNSSNPVQEAVISYDAAGRRIYDFLATADMPEIALLNESGNRVHTRWSIIDGPTDEGAFLDETITIDPYTGYLNVSGQEGEIANRDLIGTYIYVMLEFETMPYPRFHYPGYIVERIRIADPPRVPTYVRLFTVDSPSFEFDDATEDLPLEFNAGMQAVRGVVFDQLRYEYNWGGAIHIGATDLGALVFDNPGVLPNLLHASPHIFPSIVFRSDAADITNTNVRVIIIVDGVHIYTDVPLVEPIMQAGFGFGLMAPFFIVDDYYEEEYVPVVEEEEVYESYEEEVYDEYEEYEVYETYEDELEEESGVAAGIAAYALGGVLAAANVLGAQ